MEENMPKSHMKTPASILMLVPVLCLLSAGLARGQEQEAKKPETKTASSQQQTKAPVSIYRLDYRLSEWDNGKRVNSRSYTLFGKRESKAGVRTGNKVPIVVGAQSVQYQDVGISIDSYLDTQGDRLQIRTIMDVSSVAPGEGAGSAAADHPVFRSLRLDDITVVTPGKPTMVGSIDDVTSNRRYEIEVTATKVD
jgi:hypothetical protein